MKKAFIIISLLTCSVLFSDEIEHIQCEIWQEENGKFYLKAKEHIYEFDYLIHSETCTCEWYRYD